MLDIKKNRLDYGEKLIPPNGYELDFAVGTTYSLDLETLIVLPVALYNSQTFDTVVDDIGILDFIINSAKKIRVYCQKGKMTVPTKFNYLFAYWENSVQEILMNHHAQSFHPKVWIVRYICESKPAKYRLIITSRNLTKSADLDVAFTTEGEVGTQSIKKNKPLLDFINYLGSWKSIPDKFNSELAKVEFDLPDQFHLMNFHPVGIENIDDDNYYKNPLKGKEWQSFLAISPFLDDKTVKKISRSSKRKIALLSRGEEIDNLSEETLNLIEPYQITNELRYAEFHEEVVEDNVNFSLDLHAKLFVAERNNYFYWYLGSANLSDPAFERNVEFLVELKSDYKAKRPSRVLRELVKTDNSNLLLFEPYQRSILGNTEKEKDVERTVRKLLFNLSSLLINVEIEKDIDNDSYALIYKVDTHRLTIPDGFSVTMKPLSAFAQKGFEISAGTLNVIDQFNSFTLTQLTPFIHWEIFQDDELVKQFLTRCDVDLPEKRLGKILTTIIDSREKFLRYISSILIGDHADNNLFAEIEKRSVSNSKIINHYSIPGLPIYEKLLVAVSRNPQKLKSINRFIEQLKEEQSEDLKKILTPEFEEFWNVFKEFIDYDKE